MSPKESDTQPIPLPFRAHSKTAIGSARGCTQSPVPDATRTRAISIYFCQVYTYEGNPWSNVEFTLRAYVYCSSPIPAHNVQKWHHFKVGST